tara:strand:- start:352 stop:702 length:351 start_codon:yes stop_codon:yes gene_type:complete
MKMRYEVIKGKQKHFFTIDQLMKKTGCGESAIRHRMKQSHDWKVVMAKKGKHCIGGYTKSDKAKKKSQALENIVYMESEIIKLENQKKHAKHSKHPFWNRDSEEGKLHRLLWGAWC